MQLKDIYADATRKITLDLLKKENTGFDPVSKHLTWKITVNASKTPLGRVCITDELPEGLSYVAGSAKIRGLDDSNWPDDASYWPSLTDGKEVTVNAQGTQVQFDIPKELTASIKPTDGIVIVFQTKVDVDREEFMKAPTVSFANRVSMTSDENTVPITATNTAQLINKPLKKDMPNAQGNAIPYKISLNPLGMHILQGNPAEGLHLTDKLGRGLVLDENSVKRFHAVPTTILQNGAYVTILEPKPTDKGTPVKSDELAYDMVENTFHIPIPDETQPYVITYTAYATKGGTVENTIQLEGSFFESSEQKEQSHTFTLKSDSSARLSLPADLFWSLAGAKFRLYKDAVCMKPAGSEETTGENDVIVSQSVTNEKKSAKPAKPSKPNSTDGAGGSNSSPSVTNNMVTPVKAGSNMTENTVPATAAADMQAAVYAGIPKTGVEDRLWVWITGLCLCLAGAAVSMFCRRQKNKK